MRTRLILIFLILTLLTPLSAVGTGSKNPQVVLETSMGNIVLELFLNRATKTVDNFLGYVRWGHYDGTVFHRVIPNFMIQGAAYPPI